MIVAVLVMGGLMLSTAPASGPAGPAFVEVDYAKVERRLLNEPRYNAQPLYALFIFDPQARFRVWAVLDKSKAELPHYDVLYLDRNGNGDLTEPGERFTGSYDATAKRLTIPVGQLAVPGTSLVHTDLQFVTVEGHGYLGTWFSMKWGGRDHVDGGYKGLGTDNTIYATLPPKAPVLRPTILGPLTFALCEDYVLAIGKTADVQLLVGSRGSGPDTLCAVHEHFLQPGKDRLTATLIARDRTGQEIRAQAEIKRHC